MEEKSNDILSTESEAQHLKLEVCLLVTKF